MEANPRVDTCTGRPSIEECLPRDALEEIMGYLDQETFCSARLVSRTFCAAASVHVSSLTLPDISQAVSFHGYAHLTDVTVVLNRKEESLAQLEPRLRNLTTTVIVKFRPRAPIMETLSEVALLPIRETLSEIALLPKLRRLAVHDCVKDGAASLRLCTNLEALYLYRGCSEAVAMAMVTLTRLTSLSIGTVLEEDGNSGWRFARDSWLKLATNLKNLQELHISTPYEAVSLVGKLTGLTGLTMYHNEMLRPTYSIAPLGRLTRLRSLYLAMYLTESNLGIACSLGSGSLIDLELEACEQASSDCGKLVPRQTALTQLSLGQQLCNLRHIAAVRIELLQCLELWHLDVLDVEGLAVLSRATSLTNLVIGSRIAQPQAGLSQCLGRLTKLRTLRFNFIGGGYDPPALDPTQELRPVIVLDIPLALGPLTGLTKLEIESHVLDNGGLQALLLLTELRVLQLYNCPLTVELLPELGVLMNLHTLHTVRCGVTSLAPVSTVLNPLRVARGLPPMQTLIEYS